MKGCSLDARSAADELEGRAGVVGDRDLPGSSASGTSDSVSLGAAVAGRPTNSPAAVRLALALLFVGVSKRSESDWASESVIAAAAALSKRGDAAWATDCRRLGA